MTFEEQAESNNFVLQSTAGLTATLSYLIFPNNPIKFESFKFHHLSFGKDTFENSCNVPQL